MGEFIAQKRAVELVADAIFKTLSRARERDDWVRERVEERLGRHELLLNQAAEAKAAAARTEEKAFDALLYRVQKARVAYCQVRDVMWNTLGRPKNDPAMDTLFPEGVAGVTGVAPSRLVHELGVVAEQLRSLVHPQLDAATLAQWAGALETAAGPLAEGVAELDRASVKAHRARAVYVAAVRTAWLALRSLKRVLKADGLTEVQVHAIIPEAPRPRKRKGSAGAGDGGDAAGGPPPTGIG